MGNRYIVCGCGKMVFNPMFSYVIETGDKLIALGEEENLIKFSGVCQA